MSVFEAAALISALTISVLLVGWFVVTRWPCEHRSKIKQDNYPWYCEDCGKELRDYGMPKARRLK